jgi:hypothetical protein
MVESARMVDLVDREQQQLVEQARRADSLTNTVCRPR